MSPRRNRPRRDVRGAGGSPHDVETVEDGADGAWVVRRISGERATKVYRCPGCDHEIRVGAAHVVAWPADGLGSTDDRRHWHTPCWQRRAQRRPR